MKGKLEKILALSVFMALAQGQVVTALPKDTQIVRVAMQENDYSMLRNGLRPVIGVNVNRDAKSSTISLNTTTAGEKRSIYRIITRVNDKNAIGISGNSTESGARAITWDNDFTVKVQEFAFVPVGNKNCIISGIQGKALTDENKKGAAVTLQTYTGNDGQLFTIEESPEGFVSIKSSSGYYVGISAGSRKRGTPIITWDRTDNSSLHFMLLRID